jgi:cytochrome c556
MRSLALALALALALPVAACGAPVKNTPIEDIPKLGDLEDVMDNAATSADPQFKKIGQAAFADAELAGLALTAQRVGAVAHKLEDFSKGPEFDALGVRLGAKAEALGAAATAKDAAAVNVALRDMKATCKECHSKFK